jgi:hypothetical protein
MMETNGFLPQRADVRHVRAKLCIPAGTSSTFAKGVDPDVKAGGKR